MNVLGNISFVVWNLFSGSLNNYIDPEYRKFLESYATDNEKMTSTPETLLEEIEAKNRELIGKCAKGIRAMAFSSECLNLSFFLLAVWL